MKSLSCEKKKIIYKCRGSCGQTVNLFFIFFSSSLLEEGKSVFFSLSPSCARPHCSISFSSSSANFLLMGFLPQQEASNRLLHAKTLCRPQMKKLDTGWNGSERASELGYLGNEPQRSTAQHTMYVHANGWLEKKKKGKGNTLDADSSGGHQRRSRSFLSVAEPQCLFSLRCVCRSISSSDWATGLLVVEGGRWWEGASNVQYIQLLCHPTELQCLNPWSSAPSRRLRNADIPNEIKQQQR